MLQLSPLRADFPDGEPPRFQVNTPVDRPSSVFGQLSAVAGSNGLATLHELLLRAPPSTLAFSIASTTHQVCNDPLHL